MRFRIRTRETEEDVLFFDKLNFESFRLTMLRDQDVSEEEAKARFIEFDESDPVDPWGPDHQVFFAEDDEGDLAGLIWMARREPRARAARQLYESLGYKLVATHNESCFYEKKI